MVAVFSYSNDRVGGAVRLLVSFSPVKVNAVVYLVVRGGSLQGSPYGSPRSGDQSFQLSPRV